MSLPESPFRAFIGIPIPTPLRDRLVAVQTRLQRAQAHVSWVRRANLHISLVFLGEIRPETAEAIIPDLDAVASQTEPFSCAIETVGAFGRPGRPRVIWAGVEPVTPLLTLQRRIADIAATRAIAVDTRPYQPHITLGRAKSSRGAADLSTTIAKAESTPFGVLPVQTIHLVSSRLTPQGARYETVHTADL